MLEILCVAFAVYFEARGEPAAGRDAVASVVWNRVDHPEWPNNACSVVSQFNQFETYPFDIAKITDEDAFVAAMATASYTADEPTEHVLFFESHPTSKFLNYKYLYTIGNHDFYTLKD